MKQIQGSVRVKINEYVHAWSEFLFVSLLLIFNSFPQIKHFTILRIYIACKIWKITALTWERSSWKLVEKFHISAFPMYYSRYIWIGEHEITKLEKNLLWIQKKGHKNKQKKTWMTWNDTKWTIWYFQQCACANAIDFAPVGTTTYRMKNNKSWTRGLSLNMSVLARARAQLLNMIYISTHVSVPHGENI